MGDIVEQLRQSFEGIPLCGMCNEAADEIERLRQAHKNRYDENKQLIADLKKADQAVLDEREACATVAKDEVEPAAGEMPPEIIERVLADDTSYVESAIVSAVRSTKKNIAAAIRARTP